MTEHEHRRLLQARARALASQDSAAFDVAAHANLLATVAELASVHGRDAIADALQMPREGVETMLGWKPAPVAA